MTQRSDKIEVYLEIVASRTFASALEWPGWSRGGRDEASALQALIDYGPRYAHVLQRARLGFRAPSATSDLVVVERLKGNVTTDFGAPNLTLPGDTEPVSPTELQHYQAVLKACWRAFDNAVKEATGETLRKGPRGGGRDLAKIVEHVQGVEVSYLSSLGGKLEPGQDDDAEETLDRVRKAILGTLAAAVKGEIPTHGPRGGVRWTPRYFVRRLAWHDLDHVWEIEDRVE